MRPGISAAQQACCVQAETDALQIRRLESRTHVLALVGELDLVTCPFLARAMDYSEMPRPVPAVELDFRGVQFVDLAAIRWLCKCREGLREQGGDLIIRNVTPWVHKVIDLIVQGESLVAQ